MADEVQKPQATVRIEKTIRNAPVGEEDMEMIEEAGSRKPGRPPKKSPMVDDSTDEDEFHRLLQDHTIRIHVDRVSPREWKGKQISGMIEEYVPPTTQEEIETDIRQRFGGGRYRIRILKNGKFLGARGVSIYGDPKIQEEDEFDPEVEGFEGMPFREGSMAGPPVMDDEITSLKKEIEKERLKKILKETKDDGSPVNGGVVNPEIIRREAEERARREMKFENDLREVRSEVDRKLDGFLSSLKDTLRSQKETDPGRSSDIVALDNKVERLKTEIMADVKSNMSELKALLMQPKQEKPDQTPQLFAALIDGFSKMNQSSEAKLTAIAEAEKSKTQTMMTSMQAINDANAKVAQAQTAQLVTVLQSQRSEGGIDGIAKTVSAVRDIAESMGLGPAGGAEAAEPPDITTRILGMVEKALPTLLAAQKAKSDQTGQQLTKAEIEQIIAHQARQAAAQQVAAARQRAAQTGLPVPASTNVPPPRPAQTGQPPRSPLEVSQRNAGQPPRQTQSSQPPPQPQAEQPPPPTPAPTAQASPAATGNPENPAPATETVAEVPVPTVVPATEAENMAEHDKKLIVDNCMERLLREIRIRPRVQSWNEYAYDTLPDEILEKLILATDADGVLEAVKVYSNPEYIDAMKEILKAEQRAVDWFVKGLNEMKTWYVEEEEGEEGEEGEEVEETEVGEGQEEEQEEEVQP